MRLFNRKASSSPGQEPLQPHREAAASALLAQRAIHWAGNAEEEEVMADTDPDRGEFCRNAARTTRAFEHPDVTKPRLPLVVWENLQLIAKGGCEHYTGLISCRQSLNRNKYARFGAESWCAACLAAEALDALMGKRT